MAVGVFKFLHEKNYILRVKTIDHSLRILDIFSQKFE